MASKKASKAGSKKGAKDAKAAKGSKKGDKAAKSSKASASAKPASTVRTHVLLRSLLCPAPAAVSLAPRVLACRALVES